MNAGHAASITNRAGAFICYIRCTDSKKTILRVNNNNNKCHRFYIKHNWFH